MPGKVWRHRSASRLGIVDVVFMAPLFVVVFVVVFVAVFVAERWRIVG